jgi:hypothetical protein
MILYKGLFCLFHNIELFRYSVLIDSYFVLIFRSVINRWIDRFADGFEII